MNDLLTRGALEIEGRLLGSSNAALLVDVVLGGETQRAVYKPLRGERPLWDFPSGTLGRREVATAVVDDALGWGMVPVTVWRDQGPLGPGSLQAWVDADEDRPPVDVIEATSVADGWIVVAEGEGVSGGHVCLVHEDSPDLRRIAALDLVINNADRKGGHVLRSASGALSGIDHGLTFHVEDKLRTVLWGWSGTRFAPEIREDLQRLRATWDDVAVALAPLLSRGEIRATRERLEQAIAMGGYPEPLGPWPALPWPAM